MKCGPVKACHKLQPLKTLQLGVTVHSGVVYLTVRGNIRLVG